jgi:hypothetical protein
VISPSFRGSLNRDNPMNRFKNYLRSLCRVLRGKRLRPLLPILFWEILRFQHDRDYPALFIVMLMSVTLCVNTSRLRDC